MLSIISSEKLKVSAKHAIGCLISGNSLSGTAPNENFDASVIKYHVVKNFESSKHRVDTK